MKTSIKSQLGLLILNRNNLHIFTPSTAGFITLNFPETLVKDLEIINQDELENLIKQFVESSQISPAELTMILSDDILLEKEIAGGLEESTSRQKFLDSLPFESIYKIVIPKDQKPHIITVNREFVDGIILAFSKLDFTTARAVPYEFLRKNSIQTVDVNNAMDIIKKAENMKLYNLLDYYPKGQTNPIAKSKEKDEKSSKLKLYVMLGVLGVLTFILLFSLARK